MQASKMTVKQVMVVVGQMLNNDGPQAFFSDVILEQVDVVMKCITAMHDVKKKSIKMKQIVNDLDVYAKGKLLACIAISLLCS